MIYISVLFHEKYNLLLPSHLTPAFNPCILPRISMMIYSVLPRISMMICIYWISHHVYANPCSDYMTWIILGSSISLTDNLNSLMWFFINKGLEMGKWIASLFFFFFIFIYLFIYIYFIMFLIIILFLFIYSFIYIWWGEGVINADCEQWVFICAI